MKEAEVTRTVPSSKPVYGNIRHGFVYECVPHITLKSIANNAEIDQSRTLQRPTGATWRARAVCGERPGWRTLDAGRFDDAAVFGKFAVQHRQTLPSRE